MIDYRDLDPYDFEDTVVYRTSVKKPGSIFQIYGDIVQVFDDCAVMKDRDGHRRTINEETADKFFFKDDFLKLFKEELITLIDEVTPARDRKNKEEKARFEPLPIKKFSREDREKQKDDYAEILILEDMLPVAPSCRPEYGMFFMDDEASAVGFSRVLADAKDLALGQGGYFDKDDRPLCAFYIKRDATFTLIRPGTDGKNMSYKMSGEEFFQLCAEYGNISVRTADLLRQEEKTAASHRQQTVRRR